MPFGLWTWVSPRNLVLDGVQTLTRRMWGGNFEGEKGPAQETPGYVWWSRYSKRLTRGQHRYSADADWGVLDGSVPIGTTWRIQLNCGGYASLCQIALTTYWFLANCMLSPVCLSLCHLSSVVCRLSCTLLSWNFWQCFYAIRYRGHPLTSTENFTKIVPGEPLRWTV